MWGMDIYTCRANAETRHANILPVHHATQLRSENYFCTFQLARKKHATLAGSRCVIGEGEARTLMHRRRIQLAVVAPRSDDTCNCMGARPR